MPEEILEILDHLPTYVRYIFMYIHIYIVDTKNLLF